jgi:hypothetical protein
MFLQVLFYAQISFFALQAFYVSSFMFWAWILVRVYKWASSWVWMWCIIQGISVLFVVSVMATIVVSVDIGVHDTKNLFGKFFKCKFEPKFSNF